MPLYEYKCKKCGHRFERIQTYSAEDAKECPVCQGEVERLISAPAAHFKGSGFYSTDYAAKPSASGKSQDPRLLPSRNKLRCCGKSRDRTRKMYDGVPQGLKPRSFLALNGTTKVVP